MSLTKAYDILLISAVVVLALVVFICFIRAVRGPTIADRIVAINMIGTMTIIMIAVLALLLEEGYLVDVSIVYAMISFLAVVVLTKIYLGVYLEIKSKKLVQEKEEKKE